MRKKLMASVLSVALAGLTLAGCGEGKAPETSNAPAPTQQQTANPEQVFKGRTLVVSSYGGALDEALKKHVITKFEQETGGKVILDPSAQFAKLVAEKDDPSVDLAFLDDARVVEGGKLGILEKLDSSKISNWNNLYPQAIDKNGFGVAWVFGSYGIVYRTDKINPAPSSWADLWKPEYAKKVAVNDLVSNGGVQAFVASAKLKGGDEKQIDAAFDQYKALAPNLLTISQTTAQLTDMLTRGDVWIAPWWDGRALNLAASNVPVGFVRPKEGAYATIVEFGITKNSKNKDMAYKLIDMALSPEAQQGFAKDMYYGPTNKTVKLSDDLAQKVVYGEEAVKALQFVDWDYIASVRSQWIDRWNKEIVPLIK